MMTLAPIVIMTYSRLEHLKQTIASLRRNQCAAESELYILLDAPRPGDEIIVGKVKSYVHNITGFKRVIILEQKQNSIINNFSCGLAHVFSIYDRIIFLEDDNIVSDNFLYFMNQGLDLFKDNTNVIAISGYNVPAHFPNTYRESSYYSYYFNAWGVATWKDRNFPEIALYRGAFDELCKDSRLRDKVFDIHPGLIHGLKRISEGNLIASDFNMTFHSIKHDMFSLRPIISLVDNIGHDGSGMNCAVSKKFRNQLKPSFEDFAFNSELRYNRALDQIYYTYLCNNRSLLKRVASKAYATIINYFKSIFSNKNRP